MISDPNEFAHRYVAVWNEPDPELRRQVVADVWATDYQFIDR